MKKENDKIDYKSVPELPGVYVMRDSSSSIIYIGKAKNLKKRISSYFKINPSSKVFSIMSVLRHIDYILAKSEEEALVIERDLIRKQKPYFNVMWKDDKSFPYIKITTNEEFPRIFITRKKEKDKSEYYGPYPNSGHIKLLLGYIMRVFKLRPCKIKIRENNISGIYSKVKGCLYLQAGKCSAPCVGRTTRRQYNENIREVKMFIKGKHGDLNKIWRSKMQQASKGKRYEKAVLYRERIKALNSFKKLVTLRHLEANDIKDAINISETLESIQKIAGIKSFPHIIEGFDISNISGSLPTGSMVHFLNGMPDKSQYRRYKIKNVKGIDDVAMIKEVVYRRYKYLKTHSKDAIPDLILIDGGKGHLNAAKMVTMNLGIKVKVISIAKRNEEIFSDSSVKPVITDPSSRESLFIQNIRNQAHRFAKSYHINRRSRKIKERCTK